MKMSAEDLDKILKRPGYRAHDQSSRTVQKGDSVKGATVQKAESVKRAPPAESKLERRMAQALAVEGMPPYQRNYFFLPDRDLELDFAWPAVKVAIEVQGMAHRVKAMFKRDIQKRALALLAGWTVLEVDREAIGSGQAVEWLLELLKRRGVKSLP